MHADLIFKLSRRELYQIDGNDDLFVIGGATELARQWSTLCHWSTYIEQMKLVLKIVMGRSVFFGIRSKGRPVSTGVFALGYCKFYDVEPEAVVIGTIDTESAHRGQGLATRSIMGAMNIMITRGYTLFYIDTQKSNFAMLRSIEKLGFGPPIEGQ